MLIDEAAVDKSKSPDELRKQFDGMELYCHAMPVSDNETIMTIRELCEMGVVRSITLHT